jgi:hypothetical protein
MGKMELPRETLFHGWADLNLDKLGYILQQYTHDRELVSMTPGLLESQYLDHRTSQGAHIDVSNPVLC